MDSSQIIDKLSELIKRITETGDWVLDPDDLKMVKSFCKRSDFNVTIVFELVMTQLKKKHAQIRYSSLQLIEQLFARSKHFRDLLTEDFPVFVQLVVGIQDKILPPPVQIAQKLREYALALIKAWFLKFGERYHQLGVAFDFLMDNGCYAKNGSALASIHANDLSRSSTDARRKAIQLDRYSLLKTDVEGHIDIIQDNLETMEGCFEILIPKNNFVHDDIDFDALMRGEASYSQKQDDAYKDTMLSHGLGSNRYTITVDLSEDSIIEDVKETDDNHIVFDQLREAYTVLETKHIPQLNVWINALVKIEIADKAEKEKLISKIINLKGKATEEARKAKMLGIQVHHRELITSVSKDDNEDDEDEYQDEIFESVDVSATKSTNNKNTPTSSKLPPTQRIFPLSFEPTMIEDATYRGPIIGPLKRASIDKGKGKADPKREDLLKRAPVVEWGEDLYYWDKKNVQFNTSGIEKNHRFLGIGEGDNEMPEQLLEQLRKRYTYYKSEAPKDLQACKHPLKNGGLCPRKDLVTCPFHGRIIPRDELGIPLNPSDVVEKTDDHPPAQEKEKSVMDNLWELIEGDVMDQSGRQKMSPKGGRKKKEKSALIDIRKKSNTSITRLKRQIDSSKTKKLVQEAAEYERQMKQHNRDKLA
ncbi:uncharacterized protein EV154DRAFT_475700 [Mucor mucedo]|uniref:uncharacterized protein n=1 Tax=Mucor mucedo TaxID=29922 RepID=UPI00221E411D|nr:uncharacterized protein EV154DRAFT_475700 [Mucor mucedo]KAI7897382.1 hypothetical protein EV154DRAFT_475700 [Mucor mucedo]